MPPSRGVRRREPRLAETRSPRRRGVRAVDHRIDEQPDPRSRASRTRRSIGRALLAASSAPCRSPPQRPSTITSRLHARASPKDRPRLAHRERLEHRARSSRRRLRPGRVAATPARRGRGARAGESPTSAARAATSSRSVECAPATPRRFFERDADQALELETAAASVSRKQRDAPASSSRDRGTVVAAQAASLARPARVARRPPSTRSVRLVAELASVQRRLLEMVTDDLVELATPSSQRASCSWRRARSDFAIAGVGRVADQRVVEQERVLAPGARCRAGRGAGGRARAAPLPTRAPRPARARRRPRA